MLHKLVQCGISLVMVSLMVLGLFGCKADSSSPGLSEPFTTSVNYFTLSGYASGYQSGGTYDFDLTLNNIDKEVWQSKYSVYLIDTKGVVLNIINQQPFTIQPEASLMSGFDMALPSDIQDGAYGLMVVFPGRGTSITTIHVGEDSGIKDKPANAKDSPPPSVGPWPDIHQLPQY